MDDAAKTREALGLLGLEPNVARAYRQLWGRAPQDAATLAAAVNASRSEAYRALDELTRRGLAAVVASRPTRYEAVEPADAFTLEAAKETAQAADVERARAAFAGSLADAWPARPEGRAGWSFRPVAGRQAIHVAALRMVRGASRSVRICLRDAGSAAETSAFHQIPEAAHQRAAQGVESRTVSRASLALATARAVQVEPTATFVVVDRRECLFLAPARSDAPVSQATWTNAGALVALAEALHDDLWVHGK